MKVIKKEKNGDTLIIFVTTLSDGRKYEASFIGLKENIAKQYAVEAFKRKELELHENSSNTTE